jgi:adenine-specific DNA glycosylase
VLGEIGLAGEVRCGTGAAMIAQGTATWSRRIWRRCRVGTYTARAIAAFGYGSRCQVVDAHVRRVVARGHGRDAGPARTPADLADVEELLPADDASAPLVSVGLMEPIAVVCTARSPEAMLARRRGTST